jgi:lipoprotein NlpI
LLYGEGKFEQALGLLSKENDPTREDVAYRSLILREVAGREQEAYRLWKIAQVEGIDSWVAGLRVLPLQLMGRPDEAREEFAALRTRLKETSRNRWYMHLADFEAGDLAEEGLLTIAGKSEWNLCEAHFYIGMKRLARGDRVGARAELQKSADTPVIMFFEYRWSKAFLKRMDADPRWPRCVPVRGGE